MYFPVSIKDESSLVKPHPDALPFSIDNELCWMLDMDEITDLLDLTQDAGTIELSSYVAPGLVAIILPRQITE